MFLGMIIGWYKDGCDVREGLETLAVLGCVIGVPAILVRAI